MTIERTLQNTEFFEEQKKHNVYHFYYYSDQETFYAKIAVPLFPSFPFTYSYYESRIDYYEKQERFPVWFEELIKEVEEKIEKRDRFIAIFEERNDGDEI